MGKNRLLTIFSRPDTVAGGCAPRAKSVVFAACADA